MAKEVETNFSDSDRDLDQDQAQLIAHLNDSFRKNLLGGRILMTVGVQALAQLTQFRALQAIQNFDDFTPDNDPWGHHDFGEVKADDIRIWWKIDCFDKSLQSGSPNAADPTVTTRVMTILLPEEY